MKGRLPVGGRITGVGFWDSLWLVIALISASLPLVQSLGIVAVVCFVACALLHLRAVNAGFVLPAVFRYAVLVLVFGNVYLVHRTFWGMEAGTAIILALFCIKLLELRTRREYTFAANLGFFLILCGIFDSQDFLLCAFSTLNFFLLTSTLLRFHSFGLGTGERVPLRERLREVRLLIRSSLVTALQALPIIVLLFFFFPRASQGFGLHLFRNSLTGMSDFLSPGSVEKLVQNGTLAFRARFLNGNPGPPPYYWRGLVLWHCKGLEWEKGSLAELPGGQNIPQSIAIAKRVKQEIILEPHGKHWLFALDKPLLVSGDSAMKKDAEMRQGRFLVSHHNIESRRLYDVISGPVSDNPTDLIKKNALQVSSNETVPDRVAALVAPWRRLNPKDRVVAAERFFSKGFKYTMSSGVYSGDSWQMLDEFLFLRRRGFCEHYAAAFASLMRLSKVPARVVLGYYGGDFNPVGKFYSVYQSDAHAWCEVWLDGAGWVRVDPTAFVVGRGNFDELSNVNNQANAANASALAAAAGSQGTGTLSLWKRLRFAWGTFNYNWAVWVLGYDHDLQAELLDWLGLRKAGWPLICLGLVGLISTFLVALHSTLRWRGRRKEEPVLRAYRQLCRKVASVSVARADFEPPAAYLKRVVTLRPDLEPSLAPLFQQYIRLQYAPWKIENSRAALRLFQESVRSWSARNTPGV